MQLDLFLDSRDTQLRNEAIDALRRRDGEALRQAIGGLRAEYPDDHSLADLDLLAGTALSGAVPDSTPDSAPQIAERLALIDTELAPALRRLLGEDSAGRWLAPLFDALAASPAARTFRREHALTHAGALFLRGNDLAAARAAVTRIPSWRKIPEPLSWMTEIAWREDRPAEYWPLSVELAWIAPSLFDSVLSRAPEAVRRLHGAFFSEFESDEGSDDSSSWFPAWLLVEHSELLEYFRPLEYHPSNAARCAAVLVNLLTGERNGLSSKLVEQRSQLRALAPRLFARYMALR
ncbi:MAG: hypothetical protein LBE85_04495 [Candidatus Accumulibacter sp.]|jgi:hypothetical protein|nr:hypothetical protein [Accumulibacter sp.]